MKSLKLFLEEAATPANTMGMGDPAMPTETNDGTDPIPTGKVVKQKRKKRKCEDFGSCK